MDGLDLDVAAGDTLCIVGESGCGKSLTALALMGLLPKSAKVSGRREVDGQGADFRDAHAMDGLRGDRIAMIFQEPMTSLNPAFSVGSQIAEAVLCHHDVTRTEAEARAVAIMARVGISDPQRRMRQYPHEMSGGMRQRIMIAMALVNEPRLLIADEPTTALDVTIQAQILDLIAQMQADARMGLVLITHDLGVVAQIATRVAVMYAGRVVESGSAAEVFADPQHPYTLGLLGSLPSLSGPRGRLATIPGSVPPAEAMPPGCRFASRCPFAAPICATRPPLRQVGGAGHDVACHFAPLDQYFRPAA
ncbi:ABC transporter ATP-binding protein [Paracoccus suum]|uniref:ABC transporter ATP-binding protein n=1 Tax=Paracoccus suum TaxID=2259340 RepID=UPI001F5468FC|nr:ABC transporter ATP-binding protein [Paracoccus suum]